MTTQNNPVDSVDAAIAAAAAQAAQTTQQTTAVDLVPQASQGTAVQSYAPAAAPSLDGLSAGSMNVDEFLKVKEHGLILKDKIVESLIVDIDFGMAEAQPFTGVKYGDPVEYKKTYDGITEARGGPWSEALRQAKMVDPNVFTYGGVDLQATLVEDAKDLKGAVIMEAGTRIGHSTSTTNRNAFAQFYKAVKAAGLEQSRVRAKLGSSPMKSPKGSWGIVTFELIGAAE